MGPGDEFDDEDLGGDEGEMTPEEEQALIDKIAEEQIAATNANRDVQLIAAGVEPPQPKKARGGKKKKVEPAPVTGASADLAARCLVALKVLRDIGVSDPEMAKALGVSRATVNNIVNEKRGARLAGSKAEFDAINLIVSKLSLRLERVYEMMHGEEVDPELLWPEKGVEGVAIAPPEAQKALAEALDATEPPKEKWVDDSDPHKAIAEVMGDFDEKPVKEDTFADEEEDVFATDEEENPFAEEDDTFGDESV